MAFKGLQNLAYVYHLLTHFTPYIGLVRLQEDASTATGFRTFALAAPSACNALIPNI